MKKITLSSGIILAALTITVGLFSGCSKPEDTIAKVYVFDEDNNPVSGAKVALNGNPSDEQQGLGKELVVADTSTSNAAGEAIFNLNDLYKSGQAG